MSGADGAAGPLVLLVEDDVFAAELLTMRLASLGCRTLLAGKTEDGLALARAHEPNLVLVDLKLAEDPQAGVSLVHALRADPATADLRIAVHSVYVSRRAELASLAGVADGFLTKPFKLAELRELLETLCPGALDGLVEPDGLVN